jgi:antitoxin YefM
MNAFKYRVKIKNGKLDLPILDFPEGTVVEAILLVNENAEVDETEYLLSTEANRHNLMQALDELKKPQNYIYVDPATL